MLSAHFPPRKQKRFHGDHSTSDVVMLVSELPRRSTSVGVSLDKEGFSFGGQRLGFCITQESPLFGL